MELKSVFEIVKADRYSQEGCEKIAAETEDKIYKTGEISTATGLQKQPDGSWAPSKSTKYGKVTTNKEGKVGIQQTLGKGSKFEEFANEKSASRALANLTAGYNTTERSKQDPHSDKARQQKQWNKEVDKIKKENKADRRAERAAEFKKKDDEKRQTVVNFLMKVSQVPEESAKKAAEELTPGLLNKMYDNIKKEHGDKYDAGATAKPAEEKSKVTAGQNKLAEIAKISGNYNPENLHAEVTPKGNIAIIENKNGRSHSIMTVDPNAYHLDLADLDEEGILDKPNYEEDTPRTPAPEDAAPDHTYTQQSINGWREMTGDTKIRIKK